MIAFSKTQTKLFSLNCLLLLFGKNKHNVNILFLIPNFKKHIRMILKVFKVCGIVLLTEKKRFAIGFFINMGIVYV